MRSLVLRCRAALAGVGGIGLTAHSWAATQAHAAPPEALPTHFAGEALTVALAFCFPALVAGAYLGLKRMNARLGGRSLTVLMLAVIVLATTAYLVEDANALLQRAGLASTAP